MSYERKHPPLKRVSRGAPVRVDPTLHCEPDSCYSSCSEESHPSLSRESSDGLSAELASLRIEDVIDDTITPTAAAPSQLIDFARSLGYSEQQLLTVIERIGVNANQDSILAELVKLGSNMRRQRSEGQLPVIEPQLRSIVIDGSNIAMTHGRKEVFSCSAIRDCVNFFTDRGHKDVLVIIPQFRRETARADCPITDQHVLSELDQQGRIVWTPSRRIGGRRIVCHDDRYILKTAEEKDAVVVSNDEYRDLIRENPQYKELVENRLLMYSFVDGRFMPPDDPLGRHGPTLDQFLSKNIPATSTQLCPYARKCTYGNKCKYFHPERPNGIHVSVTERLKEKNQKRPVAARSSMQYERLKNAHNPVGRTQSLNTDVIYGNQENIFGRPNQLFVQQWHQQHNTHNAVVRNQSVPLAHGTPSREDAGHLYAPSTAVWGNSEFSVGPLVSNGSMTGSNGDLDRSRLQYNLCQLFPEPVVLAVMAAHPQEMNSQVLCEHILAMTRSFCGAN